MTKREMAEAMTKEIIKNIDAKKAYQHAKVIRTHKAKAKWIEDFQRLDELKQRITRKLESIKEMLGVAEHDARELWDHIEEVLGEEGTPLRFNEKKGVIEVVKPMHVARGDDDDDDDDDEVQSTRASRKRWDDDDE